MKLHSITRSIFFVLMLSALACKKSACLPCGLHSGKVNGKFKLLLQPVLNENTTLVATSTQLHISNSIHEDSLDIKIDIYHQAEPFNISTLVAKETENKFSIQDKIIYYKNGLPMLFSGSGKKQGNKTTFDFLLKDFDGKTENIDCNLSFSTK